MVYYGEEAPLALPEPPVHLLGFLDLMIFTGLRDLLACGVSDDRLSAVREHVFNNQMLQHRVAARWALPGWAGPHAHQYFIICPLFMEDRESFCVVKNLVTHGLKLSQLVFLTFVRRVLRSSPITWAKLEPLLVQDLQRGHCSKDRLRERITSVALALGLTIPQLYGPGQHWFSPELEDDAPRDWLDHSVELLQSFKKLAGKLAGVLQSQQPSAQKLSVINELVQSVPGAGSYVSKFVQGDMHLLSLHCRDLSPITLDDRISIGPGCQKFLEMIFWQPTEFRGPMLGKQALLPTLKWLSDQLMLAVDGQHPTPCIDRLGRLLKAVWDVRSDKLDSLATRPSLHDLQVRCCVTHIAHYSFHRYQSSTPTPILHNIVLDPAQERDELIMKRPEPIASKEELTKEKSKWAKARAATKTRKTMPCRTCPEEAESFSKKTPGSRMRWRCAACGESFQTRCPKRVKSTRG